MMYWRYTLTLFNVHDHDIDVGYILSCLTSFMDFDQLANSEFQCIYLCRIYYSYSYTKCIWFLFPKLVSIRGPFISRYISNESSKDNGFIYVVLAA